MTSTDINHLEGVDLNLAVAEAMGYEIRYLEGPVPFLAAKNAFGWHNPWSPSTNWNQGGPLIEGHQIDTEFDPNGKPVVRATMWLDKRKYQAYGPTPLIAAMRCLVAGKRSTQP